MNLHDPAVTFAIALFASVLAQSLAHHLRIPGIILLLFAGIGLEAAHIIHVDQLEHALHPIVGLSVAVILFEGGLNLNIERLRREALTIRRLITVGAIATALGAMAASWAVMGWDWRLALLFGTLVIVTGPTVINPILRRVRIKPQLHTILEAEGILIDPIGAIIAVVALEVILATTGGEAAFGLLGLPSRLGLGLALGVAGGAVIGILLRLRNIVPLGFENIFTLGAVLVLFEISDSILAESGIMTVAIAGLVVGNMKTRVERELAEFKEQLTILLVGLLFVLLSAAVPMEDVWALGWPGLLTVLLVIFLVRPLDVLISTAGSSLQWRDRAFIAWLAPRGIVAFAVSSLFAERLEESALDPVLVAGGADLRAMVFLVIAVTVLLLGGLASPVASLLRVRRPANHGHVIVGANPLGRALGRALRHASGPEEPVLMIDSNAAEVRAAEAQGLRTLFGNAADRRVMRRADVEVRRSFVALTPNEGVNLLLAQKAQEDSRTLRTVVGIDRQDAGVVAEQVHEQDARILFGGPINMDRWAHAFLNDDARFSRWRYGGSDRPMMEASPEFRGRTLELMPMVLVRGSTVTPADDHTSIRKDDEVYFAWTGADATRAREWLEAAGWEAVSLPEDVPQAAEPQG